MTITNTRDRMRKVTMDKDHPRNKPKMIKRINSRIHGYSQVLLKKTGDFTKRLIGYYHQRTLHEGVQATICGILERFWNPKLRSAVKSIIYNCNLCKRYCKGPLKPPAVGNLLRFCLGKPFQRGEIWLGH